MWEDLTLDEIVQYLIDNNKKPIFILCGFNYIFDHKVHPKIFRYDGIINTPHYQRLINLVVESYKENNILIRKINNHIHGVIQYKIYRENVSKSSK